MARQSNGTLFIPCSEYPDTLSDEEIAKVAGADLLMQAPEIANWIKSFKQPLTLGNYAYLDGAKHVQVVMAMDAINQHILQSRDDIKLAYLLTPSDVYAVPKNVMDCSNRQYHQKSLAGMVKRFSRFLSAGQLFSASIVDEVEDGMCRKVGILDNLVPQQGPNYVLAKRIQRWRAIIASKEGIKVSCNVAPASYTQSVMSNQFFAAASLGSESFGVEVFTPQTANILMTLQMVSDISQGKAIQRGERLFMHGVNHGGAWRIGYCFRSMLLQSLFMGLLKGLLPKDKFKPSKPVLNVSKPA